MTVLLEYLNHFMQGVMLFMLISIPFPAYCTSNFANIVMIISMSGV